MPTPYALDLPAAARRHLAAADALADGSCRRVAGYLYGIAAECAVKAMMPDAGVVPLALASRQDDPFYAHFPKLRTMLKDRLEGRRGGPLERFIRNDAFMNHWDTAMRYCKGDEIQDSWIKQWQSQARDVVSAIGT